ncbi:hypothetical protein Tco_0766261, partial [Tanacetum coccineum]
MNEDKIKQELEEIETINIELDHRVTKLIAENKHLKQTYKQLYDSIKPARIRSKEQCDDLINQVNLKSVEISDLNTRLQEKVLVITALKNDLRKLKGKDLADNAGTKHTIDPAMLKIDVDYLNRRLLNNRPLFIGSTSPPGRRALSGSEIKAPKARLRVEGPAGGQRLPLAGQKLEHGRELEAAFLRIQSGSYNCGFLGSELRGNEIWLCDIEMFPSQEGYLRSENEELLEVEEVQQIEEHMASSLDQQRPPWSYKVEAIPHSANDSLPVIITSDILGLQEEALLKVLTKYKEAIRWTIIDLKGISPSLCMHKIVTEPQINPSRDAQRRVNHNMRDVVKKEVLKWLDVGIIYPISDSKWYEQFTILEEESIDSGFARFNTIITSLKALDKAKVMAIEESKDLSSLALDELIDNLKVHEFVMEKDSEIYRGKKEKVKSIALKTKKESSDDENLTSGSDDEEYAMAVRNFKKFFRRKGKFVRQPREQKKSFRQRGEKKGKSDRKFFRCGDPNHLIGDCPKPRRNKDHKDFIGGSWSDSENEVEDKIKDETCPMAQSSNEVTLDSSHYSDNAYSLDDDSLGFDSSKASTSGTKPINFVRPYAETARDGSTIEAYGSTVSGFVDSSSSEKLAEHVFSPLMSSRSDFVITRKKLIHNKIEEAKKPSLKPSLKSGL